MGKTKKASVQGGRSGQVPSDEYVKACIEVEFDRTLPFWRCFTDLRATHKHTPVVMRRLTKIMWRKPCDVFSDVEVVWAITRVHLRVRTADTKPAGRKRQRSAERKPLPSSSSAAAAAAGAAQDWSSVPFHEVLHTLGTMHFVHRSAEDKNSEGYSKSFHIQSVVLYENPYQLQCVAGTMVYFGFTIYTAVEMLSQMQRLGLGENARAFMRDIFNVVGRDQLATVRDAPLPPPKTFTDMELEVFFWPDTYAMAIVHLPRMLAASRGKLRSVGCAHTVVPTAQSRWLILGMGGNSMAVGLRHLLGPEAEIHVVEIEPAVVETCRCVGTAPESDKRLFVHLKSAEDALKGFGKTTFGFILMDVFEPHTGHMDNRMTLLTRARERLAPDGFLWVNDHSLPTPLTLQKYYDLFGPENVQAVNLRGWNESVIVCRNSGDTDEDKLMLQCTKVLADNVSEVYEKLLPGWLPPATWLASSTVYVLTRSERSRIWRS